MSETAQPDAAENLAAAEEFVAGLSDSQRSAILAKALQSEAGADPNEWRYIFAIQNAADSVRGVLTEVRDAFVEMKAAFDQSHAEMETRAERESKLIAPIVKLVEALTAMANAQHVTDASEKIIADANETFKGFAGGASKVIRGAATERRVLLWIIAGFSAASFLVSIAVAVAVLRR